MLVAASMMVAGCGGSDSIAPVGRYQERAPPARAAAPRARGTHVVARGETLYSIAWSYALDYREIARWNGFGEPYTIYPGQQLRLTPPAAPVTNPGGSEVAEPSRHPTGVARRVPEGPSVSVPPTLPSAPPPAATASASPPPPSSPVEQNLKTDRKPAAKGHDGPIKRWYWPAEGKVVRTFARSGGKGIDIAGRLGQPVLATSDGLVVYSGSGLIGYGQLIIVKHNKRYLSAYAHNNKILVKEGDEVRGGQRIAEMGRSGAKEVMLHFEIRRDGRPTDPLRYLPK